MYYAFEWIDREPVRMYEFALESDRDQFVWEYDERYIGHEFVSCDVTENALYIRAEHGLDQCNFVGVDRYNWWFDMYTDEADGFVGKYIVRR